MSAQGAAAQALAGEIVAALLADEKDGGYDLTGGRFGPAFSRLVRRWAAAEMEQAAVQQAQPSGWLYGNSFWEATNPRLTDHIRQCGRPQYSRAVSSAPGTYFMGASLVDGVFVGVLQRRDPDGRVTVVDTVQTSEGALREGSCFAQLKAREVSHD